MPDDLTAALAEIRKRADAATPGPWSLDTDSDGDEYHYYGTWPYAIVMPEPHTKREPGEQHQWDYAYSELAEFTMETAEFLVHARADVPRLLAAVEAVLAFADDRERMAAGLESGTAARVHPVLERYNQRAMHDREIAAALRNAVSRALLGEDGTDG